MQGNKFKGRMNLGSNSKGARKPVSVCNGLQGFTRTIRPIPFWPKTGHRALSLSAQRRKAALRCTTNTGSGAVQDGTYGLPHPPYRA